MTTQTCKERIDREYRDEIATLRKLWELYNNDPDSSDETLGNMYEYGLAFDYVAPYTFPNQRRGYFRYQISCGGPSDEFRFYTDENKNATKIEYWFLDWFDGAHKTIRAGKDFELLNDIFQWFKEGGAVEAELTKAFADA